MDSYSKIHDDTKKRRLIPTSKQLKLTWARYRRKALWSSIAICLIYLLLTSSESNSSSLYVADPNESTNINFKTYGLNSHLQSTLPKTASLRDKLTYYFPYDPNKPVSNHIWQTWKVPLDDDTFPKNFRNFQKSWSLQNPDYQHTIIPDSLIDSFIDKTFVKIPEIIRAWKLLPMGVMKADFFRYLVVFARGGVYSDMDTVCLKPVEKWACFDENYLKPYMDDLDEVYGEYYYSGGKAANSDFESGKIVVLQDDKVKVKRDSAQDNDSTKNDVYRLKVDPKTRHTPVGLTIGIEADPDRPDWAQWYARRIQFSQWTIQAKLGHPMLRELIIRVVEETFRKEKSGNLRKVEGKDRGGDIMQWTGPGIFTDVVFDYLNNVVSNGRLGDGFGVGSKYWNDGQRYNLKSQEVNELGEPLNWSDQVVNWKTFSGMTKPVVLDDVMVLPITSFSPGVGQMGAGEPSHKLAFVQHRFEGSWKPESERM